MSLEVSIIIVSYNTKEILLNCLQSIRQWSSPRLVGEIIVVDNASTDGSAEAVENKFPNVRLLRNAANGGFAKANNQGIHAAPGKYLLLLNPDTLFIEEAITPVFEFMEKHPEAGIAGCKILNQDGSQQPSYFAFNNLAMIAWTALFLNRLAPLNWIDGKWVWRHKNTQTPFRVQKLLGAYLFVRREVFEQVGYFDENYFLFSEEEDFCYRVFKQGWAIYYFPETKIIHLGGQSTAGNKPQALLYANESMIRFFRKHYGIPTQLLFRTIWLLALLLRMGLMLLSASSQRGEMIKAYGRAMAALFSAVDVLKLNRTG